MTRLLLAGLLLVLVAGPLACARTSGPTIRTSQDSPLHVTTTTQLANGLTLIHRRSDASGIVAVVCLARPGASNDPDDKIGRSHLMMRLLSKGTTTRSSDDIAAQLENLGARLGASDGYDFVTLSLQCVKDDLAAAFHVFTDVALNPTFPIEELRTERARVLSEIRVREDRTASATMRRFREALLAPGPYARPLEGTPESVNTLTQTDMILAHREFFTPANMVISVVGDVDLDTARQLVEGAFVAMPSAAQPAAIATRSYQPRARRVTFSRESEQGFIATGTITCPVHHDDAVALDVANAVLGQGMSARLFRELRDRQGLAYSVGSMSAQYRGAGMFVTYIGTTPETVRHSIAKNNSSAPLLESGAITELDWAASALWQQVELLQQEPVHADELDRARNYLLGGYLRGHESHARQAYYLAYWHQSGLGIDYDNRYPDLVRAVRSRDIMRVANKYFVDPVTVILEPARAAQPEAGIASPSGDARP